MPERTRWSIGVVMVLLGLALVGVSAPSAGAQATPPGPTPVPTPVNTPMPAPKPAAPNILGLGRPATSSDIVAYAIPGNGKGLPTGSGTATEGAVVYAAKCAGCHGDAGQGMPQGPQLVAPVPWQVGGPITMGNFAPYAPPIFGFIWGSMPYDAPQTLTTDEAYALTAWILAQHNIIGQDDRMDATTLPKVVMPNHDAFVQGDPRPDVP